MSKWPDGTPKSKGNAFDWKNGGSKVLQSPDWKRSIASTPPPRLGPHPIFSVYSKAKTTGEKK